jgi:hypothetical protein
MITQIQIRDRLLDYLTRAITLNEFEDWLVVQSWDMHRDSDETAQSLVGAIELRLAEYSDGHLTDEGLERELKGLITSSATVLVGNAKPTKPTWTSSTASESFRVNLPASQAA